MAPRRKIGNSDGELPSNLTPPSDSDADEQRDSPATDQDTTLVHWAMPRESRDNNLPDTRDEVTRYAPALFQRPWSQLSTQATTIRFPRFRSPYYKSSTKVPFKFPSNNSSDSSLALLAFCNAIKTDTQPAAKGFAPTRGPYTQDAFNRAFSGANGGSAVVASRATVDPVLTLTEDFRLTV